MGIQAKKIAMSKTTKQDKQRHLRSQGILPPKAANKAVFGGGGEQTYDAGVVARAKEKQLAALRSKQPRYLTEEEEQIINTLTLTHSQNEKKLRSLRRKITRMTNGKTTLATSNNSKHKKQKKEGSFSNTSWTTSLNTSITSTTMSTTMNSTMNSTGMTNNDDNDPFANENTNGGDEQLPDNILNMVNDAQDWHNEHTTSNNKGGIRRSNSGTIMKPIDAIHTNAKVEVFCAIGTYMGRKKLNFVKDGIIQNYQPGKVVKREIGKRRRGSPNSDDNGKQKYAVPDGNEYYTIVYKDNDIEYDVKRSRINVMQSRSEIEQNMYRAEKHKKMHESSQFKPPKVNEIPAAVLDTTLYSRLIEDEKKRREDVKAQRHELLLSMERPFEGLQERTNEQMERKKNRKKENEEKEEREHREKKARDRIRKRRSREKADKDAEQAKYLEYLDIDIQKKFNLRAS